MTTLAWAAGLTAGLTFLILRAGLSLRLPFTAPERTKEIQVWREEGASAAILLVGNSLVGNNVTVGVLEDELHRTGRSERAFSLWEPMSELLCDAAVVEHVYARRAEPHIVLLGLGKQDVAYGDWGTDQFVRYADPSLAWWLVRRDPSWSNTRVLCASCDKGASVLLQWPLTLLPQYKAQLADTRRKRGSVWAFAPGEAQGYAHAWGGQAEPGTPEWRQMVEGLRSNPKATTPFQPRKTTAAALRRVAEVTRYHNCRLIVANMPICRERTAIERQYGYDAYVDWLRTSCTDLDVAFVDLNVDRCLPPETGFLDTQHMKPDAAERFTRQVARRIILPALEATGTNRKAQP